MPATGSLPRSAVVTLAVSVHRLASARSVLAWLVSFLAIVAFARPALAQDTGYIQVQCEPGLQIFLDGILKGVSNRDQEGLIIEDVPVGTRVVKAVKPGFTPQERRVTVGKGEVVVVRIAALRPRLVVEQGGDEEDATIELKIGSVMVKSLPVECVVDFERSNGSGGWDSVGRVEKEKPEARVSRLEIGTYRVTASRANGTLRTTFELVESDEVTVFFNFVGKSVEVSSAAARAEEARRANKAFIAAGGLVVDLGSGVSMRLVEIKPGRFKMGSPASEPNREGDETQHEVTISKAFWIGQTEVTQAQWQAVMGSDPSHFKGNPTHPVEQVSWNDAQEFCRKLSQKTGMTFRLPTEAEWEYACRAGTATAYSFGNDAGRLGEHAWFASNSGKEPFDADAMWAEGDLVAYFEKLESNGCGTKPVATRKPNAWGLYDMHGNVWEWCSDWYDEYPSGAATDPQGPRSGTSRVLRGGSWVFDSLYCRAAGRDGFAPADRDDGGGFRVARTP